MTIATYTLGPCTRPRITHDNGFLDTTAPRAPTAQDQALKKAWQGFLEAAEAGQGVPFLPHNNIPDALAAYRHFLEGTGRPRRFSYERYVANDPSGKMALKYAMFDVQVAAVDLYRRNFSADESASFSLTGTAIPITQRSARFPYPKTENWQKAIGSHYIWMCADVDVSVSLGRPTFKVVLTLHAEDMYNFNPDNADIATGLPDQLNGELEVSGLAKQYLNLSELTRTIRWSGPPTEDGVLSTGEPAWRVRQPSDNRRLRNRL